MFNAYETLGLKPVFDLDPQTLEKAYIDCMSQIHPDRHCIQSEEQRKKSLEEAAKINEAYGVLKDPLLRAHHFLGLYDPSVSFENSVSTEILMESLALRESLEEAGTSEKIGRLFKKITRNIDLMLSDLQIAFKVGDWQKSRVLVGRLTYLKKFIQEAQEKLWNLEDRNE